MVSGKDAIERKGAKALIFAPFVFIPGAFA